MNNKIDSFLDDLIEKNQNGFIEGRNIGDNICLLFDIIDKANHEKMPSAALLVNLHKAFDSLNCLFFGYVKCYDLGDSFVHWIRILHENSKCCIANANFLSSFFDVKEGLKQGYPLSSTIF